MRLTEQELLTIASVARSNWHSIPTQAKLAGAKHSHLDGEQRTTVAWVEAVVDMLVRKKLVDAYSNPGLGKLVDLEIPDLEPDTDGA
jgi:hypothetical protein